MARVRARQGDIESAKAVLLVIAAEPLDTLGKVALEEGWTAPVLADPERRVYLAYGLSRLSWYRVFTPKSAVLLLGLLLKGWRRRKPGQDVRQQGGDFILDAEGIVRFAAAGRSSHDRPAVDTLIERLRAVSPPRAGDGR